MPTLVTGAKLREAVQNETFIVGGDVASVEGVKYDFHIGSRVLKASYGQPVDLDKLPEAERSAMTVDPGEVVFVISRERMNLPSNMMAALSPKRKLAHAGIMVLGGFAVDPLFNNHLWIGLYNFSSTPFPLRPGKKVIAALFYELDEDECDDFGVPESTGQNDFPDELVALIRNYKPIELKGLNEELQETKRQLLDLRNTLVSDKQWKDDFKQLLDEHNKQLSDIINALKTEVGAREKEDARMIEKIEKIGNFWSIFHAGANFGWFLVTILIGIVLGMLVPKLFD